jgi:ADP-ribosylglycohydrolase
MESDEFGEAKELVERGLSSVDEDTVKVALRFGQGSDTSAALPVTVHLIAKHEGSLEHALLANVAAGGDSAVRGMIAGMVLAAFHGRDAIPDEWLEDLRAYKEIVALLEDLEARIQRNGLSA